MTKRFVSETTDCDFKAHVEHSRPKSWLKSVSAFANTIGGTVVFGIDDSTHEAIGIDNPQAEIEFISRMIHDRIDPIPHFEIALSGERAGAVIELRVPAGTHPTTTELMADARPTCATATEASSSRLSTSMSSSSRERTKPGIASSQGFRWIAPASRS